VSYNSVSWQGTDRKYHLDLIGSLEGRTPRKKVLLEIVASRRLAKAKARDCKRGRKLSLRIGLRPNSAESPNAGKLLRQQAADICQQTIRGVKLTPLGRHSGRFSRQGSPRGKYSLAGKKLTTGEASFFTEEVKEMSRKFLVLALVAVLLATLACGGATAPPPTEAPVEEATDEEAPAPTCWVYEVEGELPAAVEGVAFNSLIQSVGGQEGYLCYYFWASHRTPTAWHEVVRPVNFDEGRYQIRDHEGVVVWEANIQPALTPVVTATLAPTATVGPTTTPDPNATATAPSRGGGPRPTKPPPGIPTIPPP
jgi:hypothetical protein